MTQCVQQTGHIRWRDKIIEHYIAILLLLLSKQAWLQIMYIMELNKSSIWLLLL